MLKVASFDISDAEGINKALKENRLASNAHILVSDGKVCIPLEDGEPETTTHRIIAIKEQINLRRSQLDIMIHSQGVLEVLIEDTQKRLAELEPQWIKKPNDKELEARYNTVKKSLAELGSQRLQNEHEKRHIEVNIQKYEEQIAELEKQA